MKIVICGSMSASRAMVSVADELEKHGHEVVLPQSAREYATGIAIRESLTEKRQLDAIRTHYNEIKAADAILVVNETKNNTKNYIGGNSLMEMGFAYVLEKPIYLTNPIPTMSYTDEIEAVDPVVLNGSLETFYDKN